MSLNSEAQCEYEKAPPLPYAVEYYYKVRWGCFEEFLQLFMKNHYPILREQVGRGRIVGMNACRPKFCMNEETRWDYRFTIVFRNVVAAHDNSIENQIALDLFPDQDTFRREELRRFELVLAHWDTPLLDMLLPTYRAG